MNNFQLISLILSIGAIGISVYSFRETHRLNKEKKYLATRQALSEQFKPYINLLHVEYTALRERLSGLSSELCDAKTAIAEAFDRYDHRHNRCGRYLRHIYVDACERASAEFESELSWQTAQFLNNRFYQLKRIDPSLDLDDKSDSISPVLADDFIENMKTLHMSIDNNDLEMLYSDFLDASSRASVYMNEMAEPCKISLNRLEEMEEKNSIEVFKLFEYQDLYLKYIRFKRLLDFIIESRLRRIETSIPYLPISAMVYYGTLLEATNELCTSTLFRLSKKY